MPEELAALLRQLLAAIEIREVRNGIVVYPENADTVSQILKLANDSKTPVRVRQGKGYTSIDTDNPVPRKVVIDLKKMKWIRHHLADWYVEVGPAVTEDELSQNLLRHGFWFPVDLGPVTLGGAVSINMSGFQGTSKPGDFVLGFQVVLPTGEIIETGGKSPRRPTGTDLTRLFIGNQGMLGVITNIRIRVTPFRKNVAYGVAEFDSPIQVAELVKSLYALKTPMPSLCEFMDEKRAWRDLKNRNTLLLMTFEDSYEEKANASLTSILDLCKKHGATSAVQCTKSQWEVYWNARDSSHLEAGDMKIATSEVIDTVPTLLPEVMKEFLNLRDQVSREYPEANCICYGHVGVSSVHISVFCPKTWERNKELKLIQSVRDRAIPIQLRYQATVGENALFPQHARWLRELYGETYLSLIQKIKRSFDPNMILNPERIDSNE